MTFPRIGPLLPGDGTCLAECQRAPSCVREVAVRPPQSDCLSRRQPRVVEHRGRRPPGAAHGTYPTIRRTRLPRATGASVGRSRGRAGLPRHSTRRACGGRAEAGSPRGPVTTACSRAVFRAGGDACTCRPPPGCRPACIRGGRARPRTPQRLPAATCRSVVVSQWYAALSSAGGSSPAFTGTIPHRKASRRCLVVRGVSPASPWPALPPLGRPPCPHVSLRRSCATVRRGSSGRTRTIATAACVSRRCRRFSRRAHFGLRQSQLAISNASPRRFMACRSSYRRLSARAEVVNVSLLTVPPDDQSEVLRARLPVNPVVDTFHSWTSREYPVGPTRAGARRGGGVVLVVLTQRPPAR